MKYIGGDLELDLDYLKAPKTGGAESFFHLEMAHDFVWTSLGVDALALALINEGFEAGDEVCLPAYNCMKVADVVENLKGVCRYYPVAENLQVSADALLAEVTEKTKAVIWVNYFGFSKTDFELLQAIRAKNKNTAIILDFAQALFSIDKKILQSPCVDYIATSFRKSLPVPDGALLISNHKKIDRRHLSPSVRGMVWERAAAKIFKGVWLKEGGKSEAAEKFCLELIHHSETALDAGQNLSVSSRLSLEYIERTDFDTIAKKRRENARFLYQHLDQSLFLFDFDSSVVPLVIPISIPERDRVRVELMQSRIFLPVHWPLDGRIDKQRFAAAHRMSGSLLGLVVDQRYGMEHMQYLVDALKKIL